MRIQTTKPRRRSVSSASNCSPEGRPEFQAKNIYRNIRASDQDGASSNRSSSENSTAEWISSSSDPEQRNIKLSSSFNCETTSSKSTKEIQKLIYSTAQKCSLHCDKVSRYEFKLIKLNENEPDASREKIVFEVEIVKMKVFKNLKGLKFKRLEGDIWLYKNAAKDFLIALNL